MILTCSSCSTRFLVDAAAIGPVGRQVRCARCQHSWYQEPAADLPRTLTGTPRPPTANAETPRRRAPLPRGGNLPVIQGRRRKALDIRGLAALLLFAIALTGAGYGFRERIARAWPPAADLYAMLGLSHQAPSMRLVDVSFANTMVSGVPVLTVKGAIVNDAAGEGAEPSAIPTILIQLRDDQRKVISRWTHKPPHPALVAGGRADFETSLENPPVEARNLDITFAAETDP